MCVDLTYLHLPLHCIRSLWGLGEAPGTDSLPGTLAPDPAHYPDRNALRSKCHPLRLSYYRSRFFRPETTLPFLFLCAGAFLARFYL